MRHCLNRMVTHTVNRRKCIMQYIRHILKPILPYMRYTLQRIIPHTFGTKLRIMKHTHGGNEGGGNQLLIYHIKT